MVLETEVDILTGQYQVSRTKLFASLHLFLNRIGSKDVSRKWVLRDCLYTAKLRTIRPDALACTMSAFS